MGASDARYCGMCMVELFNLVAAVKDKHYCIQCVGQQRGVQATLRRSLDEMEDLLSDMRLNTRRDTNSVDMACASGQ